MITRIIFSVAFISLIGYEYMNCMDSKEKKRREVAFYCSEYEDCELGGPKVCGFDEEVGNLAYFDNICTMYKANCKSAGLYEEVAMYVCDTKRDYTTKFKDEFEFVKIIRPTPPINGKPMPEEKDETLRTAKNKNFMISVDKKEIKGVEKEKEIKVDAGISSYANNLMYMHQRLALLPKGGRKTLDKEGERESK